MKYITILFALFMAAVVVAADRGTLPASIKALYDFPNGDKVGHFVLLGILSFLVNWTVLSNSPHRSLRPVLIGSGIIGLWRSRSRNSRNATSARAHST